MSAKKIKDLGGGCVKDIVIAPFIPISEYEEFKGLLMNALTISGVSYEEEHFIKNQLIENNHVAYDTILKRWAVCSVNELDDYGAPALVTLYLTASGRQLPRRIGDGKTYYYRGIPAATTFSEIIRRATDLLQECDQVINQNLKASKTPQIVVVSDSETRLSVMHAIQQQQQGQPAIVVSPSIGEAIKGVPMSTPYIVDAVYTFRQQIRDALINKLGTMSANINKRERVQVGEVNATVGQCEDYIYMLIDSFNRQSESYGLPYRMSLNNSLEELYTGVEDTPANQQGGINYD